ncbi:MAG: DUF2183 domain-containing protein [Cryobacterium sp.]|nr:DUF2183 domain-containing protein [Cryobacterium sp.]
MSETAQSSHQADGEDDNRHLPARIEDRFHRFREKRARRRGLTPIAMPFSGYGSTEWIRVLSRVLLAKPDSSDEARSKKIRGWRSFTSIPVGNAKVTITAGDEIRVIEADRGGVIDEIIPVSLSPGWRSVELTVEGGGTVRAPVFIANPNAMIGLISDIDDTIMVTALPRPLLAAWNSFVLDEHARAPVAGMSVLYEKLVRDHPGAPVIYLSTGSWNVAAALTRFLSRHLYPPGSLLLTDWGPTHDRWFRSGKEHKEHSLERLVKEFPKLKWILVGDDGQHDEDLYSRFAETYPDRIAAIAIRQLTGGEALLAGGRTKSVRHATKEPIHWVYAPDGAGLAEQLDKLGLL